MFVAVYRWRLHPEREAQFREGWSRITRIAREQCGSGGSALFREMDGTWCAIARWPSADTRARCFASGSLDPEASELMRQAVIEALPGLEMELDTDLWAPLAGSVDTAA